MVRIANNKPLLLLRHQILLICVFFYGCFAAKAQSVEVFTGNNNSQADIQWLKAFGNNSPFLFYNRNRVTVDYHNQTGYFISGITAYQFKNGMGLANEMLFTTAGLLPKLGLQYLTSSANRTVYAFFNAGYLKEWKYGFFFFARFEPKITDKIRLYAQLELTNSSNKNGNEFLAERPRLGVGIQGVQFGAAGDFNQLASTFDAQSNIGVFIRKEF